MVEDENQGGRVLSDPIAFWRKRHRRRASRSQLCRTTTR